MRLHTDRHAEGEATTGVSPVPLASSGLLVMAGALLAFTKKRS